jgi:hypothetical protein
LSQSEQLSICLSNPRCKLTNRYIYGYKSGDFLKQNLLEMALAL